MAKPKYTHDCSSCFFLDHVSDKDLYACVDLTSPRMTSIIARYDNIDSSYISTTVGMLAANSESDSVLLFAWQKAIEKKLALDAEGLFNCDRNQFVSEDVFQAAGLISAFEKIKYSSFLTSKISLEIAIRKIKSYQFDSEEEKLFLDSTVNYLQSLVDS